MKYIERVAVRLVTEQLAAMLQSTLLNAKNACGFKDWCKGGDVFREHPSYAPACIHLVDTIAPLVNFITKHFLNYGYEQRDL